MPSPVTFKKSKSNKLGNQQQKSSQGGTNKPSAEITEPRCKVCASPHRRHIEKLLALGTSYSELQRMFKIDRRSISGHDKKHLGVQDAAFREIIKRETEAVRENIDEGVSSIVNRRVYMEAALRKALEGIVSGDIYVDAREALAIIQYLDQSDNSLKDSTINEIQIEFNAFVRAIKETVTKNKWDEIYKRTRELIEQGENVVDAEVILDSEVAQLDSGDDTPDS